MCTKRIWQIKNRIKYTRLFVVINEKTKIWKEREKEKRKQWSENRKKPHNHITWTSLWRKNQFGGKRFFSGHSIVYARLCLEGKKHTISPIQFFFLFGKRKMLSFFFVFQTAIRWRWIRWNTYNFCFVKSLFFRTIFCAFQMNEIVVNTRRTSTLQHHRRNERVMCVLCVVCLYSSQRNIWNYIFVMYLKEIEKTKKHIIFGLCVRERVCYFHCCMFLFSFFTV